MKKHPLIRACTLTLALLLWLCSLSSCYTLSNLIQDTPEYQTQAPEQEQATLPSDPQDHPEGDNTEVRNILPSFTASKTTTEYDPNSNGLIYVLWNEKDQRVIEKCNGGGWHYEYHENGALKKITYYFNGIVVGWDCKLDENGLTTTAVPNELAIANGYGKLFYFFTYGENGVMTQKSLQRQYFSGYTEIVCTSNYDESGKATSSKTQSECFVYTYENGVLHSINITNFNLANDTGYYYEVQYYDNGMWKELSAYNYKEETDNFQKTAFLRYTYDDLGGYTIEEGWPNNSGTDDLFRIYKFDAYGREIDRTEYLGQRVEQFVTEYTLAGDITISNYSLNTSGKMILVCVDFTSADRKSASSIAYDSETGEFSSHSEATENAYGVRTTKRYANDGKGGRELYFVSVYDPNEGKTVENYYQNGKISTQDVYWDPVDGKQIALSYTYTAGKDPYLSEKKIYTFSASDLYKLYEQYHYDKNGKLTEKIIYDPYCKLVYEYGQNGAYTVLAYDEKDNLLFREQYSAQGDLIDRVTYGE